MKQYESYKDSGIEWLGMIPSLWGVSKLKHHAKIVLGKMLMSVPPEGQEADYSLEKYLKSRNIGWLEVFTDDNDVEEMWFNQAEKDLYELKPNDIVMNEGGDIGKVALWKEQPYKCYIQNSVNKLTAKDDIDPRYLVYLIFSISQTNYFWSVANPVSIAHLTKEKLSETPIVIPSLDEQQIIASYLDNKVDQIDSIIAEKKVMVEDLQNYCKSIITETVTRGMNPDVPMKNSGIDWMGTIPEHWKIAKTSYLFEEIGSGTTPNTNNENYYVEDGINWLQTGDLNDGYIDKTTKHISLKALEENTALRIYPKGSLVIAMYGATIGKVGILNIETTTNQACCVLANSQNLLRKYAYYAFIASKQSLVNLAFGGGQPNISQAIIRNHKLPVPPLEEQQAIITHLDSKMQGLDFSISELQLQIEDLKSYKVSLITEAVTGKVDLR